MANAQEIVLWYNQNRSLFYPHAGKWVAFTVEEGILGSAEKQTALIQELKRKGYTTSDYILKFTRPLPNPVRPYRILPVRIRSIAHHFWEPNYPVNLSVEGGAEVSEFVLVDSGADISVISFETGRNLGLELTPAEILHQAQGVGGGIVNYALRQINIKIGEHNITAPMAWLQDEESSEMILGREVVFDQFDIEFKQADEAIIFRKRDSEPRS